MRLSWGSRELLRTLQGSVGGHSLVKPMGVSLAIVHPVNARPSPSPSWGLNDPIWKMETKIQALPPPQVILQVQWGQGHECATQKPVPILCQVCAGHSRS